MADIEPNKAVVRNFLKYLGAGDAKGMSSVITDDIEAICTGTSILSTTRNRAAVLEAAAMLAHAIPHGLKFEILNLTAEDDRVSCEVKGHATLATGSPYNNEYHFLFFLREGKICRIKEYLDTRLVDEVFKPLQATAS